MLTTTTNAILNQEPCISGWFELTGQKYDNVGWTGTDDVLTFQSIINTNGIVDTFWALRALDYLPFEKVLPLAKAIYDIRAKLTADDSLYISPVARYERGWIYTNYEKLESAQSKVTSREVLQYAYDQVFFMSRRINHQFRDSLESQLIKILTDFVNEE